MRKHIALFAVVGLITANLSLACAAKPTEEECKKLGDHFMELARKDMPPDPDMAKTLEEGATAEKTAMVSDCPKMNTKEQVACAMKADSLDKVEGCLGKKKGGAEKAPE